jgi:hypothetical protein
MLMGKKSSNGKNKNPHSHIGHSTDCTQTNCAIASTSRASVPVIFTEYDESAPRRHISSRQQTLTTANLTVSATPFLRFHCSDVFGWQLFLFNFFSIFLGYSIDIKGTCTVNLKGSGMTTQQLIFY